MPIKQIIAWIVVVLGLLGVALSYYAVWVLAVSFAAGLVWYANFALLMSGPTSGMGAVVAFRKPRQKLALILGAMGFALWVILWILSFAVLGFKLGPSA